LAQAASAEDSRGGSEIEHNSRRVRVSLFPSQVQIAG